MGSAARQSKEEKLVSVNTTDLKARLNRLYKGMRGKEAGRFDYLWDLKELALLEGRNTVDVPETWLDELERNDNQTNTQQGH